MVKNDLAYAVQAASKVKLHLNSFVKDYGRTPLGRAAKEWAKRAEWIEFSMLTCSVWDKETRDAVREELTTDPYTTDAIIEHISIMTPEQRQQLEQVVNAIRSGETLNVIINQCTSTQQDQSE